MWQRTAFVLPVMIFFIAGSNISYSSDTGWSTNKALSLFFTLVTVCYVIECSLGVSLLLKNK